MVPAVGSLENHICSPGLPLRYMGNRQEPQAQKWSSSVCSRRTHHRAGRADVPGKPLPRADLSTELLEKGALTAPTESTKECSSLRYSKELANSLEEEGSGYENLRGSAWLLPLLRLDPLARAGHLLGGSLLSPTASTLEPASTLQGPTQMSRPSEASRTPNGNALPRAGCGQLHPLKDLTGKERPFGGGSEGTAGCSRRVSVPKALSRACSTHC